MVSIQRMPSLYSKEGSAHPRERERQAHYRAYFFGPFRFFQGSRSVTEEMKRRSKAGTLLKWFLLNPGTPGSADEFLDLFWPDISSETALGNLHVTMHYLRRLLEPDLKPRQESTFIHRRANNFYLLQLDESWWVDAIDVQHIFGTARKLDQQGYDSKASFYYRKVIAHCALGFLPEDSSEEWLEPYRRRYQQIYAQSLLRMIQISSREAAWEDVVEYAYQALANDPYCEPATRAIIDAYLQQGNLVAAERALHDFCDFFRCTLGVEPGRDFHALRERIFEASGRSYR